MTVGIEALPADVAAAVAELGPERVERIEAPEVGLIAYLVVDSTVLGPAAGGVRTAAYESEAAAVRDACALARAMTYKCALAGVDAGGGKTVVLAHPELDRSAAFELLGRRVEALRGEFRTAGDLGTTVTDLEAMGRTTRYVHTDTGRLAGAVARGVVRCAEACAEQRGRPGVSGLRVAVQGCGDIGAAVAEAFIAAGAEVFVADLVEARARAVSAESGARMVSPVDLLFEDVDILAPCAVGGVLGVDEIAGLRAWAVCGGANHICRDSAARQALKKRRIAFVPDPISSAGAVIEGIGRTVMGLDDRAPLIDALRDTARLVLEDASKDARTTTEHAIRRAELRLAQAG